MARGTQHRKPRPKANAHVAAPGPKPKPKRAESHPSWEDQLFLSRLRVHAKWMFVFLALAFGLGFVLFGVGSGSSGISQAMQSLFNQSSAGGSSLSSLQKKATDHPKDATAWRNLATKLEQDQKTDLALTSLEHYVSLKPKDQNALDELASLYLRRAQDYNNAWSAALSQLQIIAPGGIFQPKSTSPLGKAYANQDPITALVVKRLDASASAASQQLGLLSSKAESAYQRLVKLTPANATYQFQYAAIAQSLGQKPIAIKAYTAFLKLAPQDALAPRARQQLKLLSPPAAKK
jgi:regulator of sirC expression with transglutaminase-like and TPR domain